MFDGLPQNDVLNTLLKARNIVEKGWCRKELHEGDKHCVLGAIIIAVTGQDVHIDGIPKRSKKLYQEVVFSFASELPEGKSYLNRLQFLPYSIPSESIVTRWNDVSHRRKGQVIKQFDKVIAQQFK